jgi:hypothetical protein
VPVDLLLDRARLGVPAGCVRGLDVELGPGEVVAQLVAVRVLGDDARAQRSRVLRISVDVVDAARSSHGSGDVVAVADRPDAGEAGLAQVGNLEVVEEAVDDVAQVAAQLLGAAAVAVAQVGARARPVASAAVQSGVVGLVTRPPR